MEDFEETVVKSQDLEDFELVDGIVPVLSGADDLRCLPADLSYGMIFSRLTAKEFFALRQLSKDHKKYIDDVIRKQPTWKLWVNEFPRLTQIKSPQLSESVMGDYHNCLNTHYSLPLYLVAQHVPHSEIIQAFLCNNFMRFFGTVDGLDRDQKYKLLHAGFPLGFFLMRCALAWGYGERLNEVTWQATMYYNGSKAYAENTEARRKKDAPIERNFKTFFNLPLTREGWNTDDFSLIKKAIAHLDVERQLQFLIGIHGEFRHLLHYMLCNSKLNLARCLVEYVLVLCESNPQYFSLVQPEGIIRASPSFLHPLFYFVAHDKNDDFLKYFEQLTQAEQFAVLTYRRSDRMTLAMVAAYNGNLDFLIWLKEYSTINTEACVKVLDITTTFGEEPLIEAWNGGHEDCVKFCLNSYEGFFSAWGCAGPFSNALPSAIADLELSTLVLERYLAKPMRPLPCIENSLKPVILKVLSERREDLLPNLIKLCSLFEDRDPEIIDPNLAKQEWVGIAREHFASLCKKGDEEGIQWMWFSPSFQPAMTYFCSDQFNPFPSLAACSEPRRLAKWFIGLGALKVVAPGQPLRNACRTLNRELLEVLLEEAERGVDIGMRGLPSSPLDNAIEFQSIAEANVNGCKSKEQKYQFVQTLISKGAEVQTLISKIAEVTIISLDNRPLISRCQREWNSAEILALLLESFPDARSRDEHLRMHDTLNGLTALEHMINSCIDRDTIDPHLEIKKLFILLQYGADPFQCLWHGKVLTHELFYPIDRNWPDEIKSIIRFACDFRKAVLKNPNRADLEKLQRQHPEGFSFLAQGILGDTLFIEPAQFKALEPLKQDLKEILGMEEKPALGIS